MDFITYILFDFVGTLQGLDVGAYIANSLKNGTWITPIIALFAFLSVMRISYHIIAEKDYLKAGKDAIFLTIFVALFAVSGNFKVWYVNITKGIYEADFIDQLNVGLDLYPDVNNQSVTVNEVPFMYSLLSISDQFAYWTGKMILDRDKIRENLLKKHLKLYPQDVVSLAVIQYASKADSVEDMAKRLKEVASCFKVDERIKKKLEKEDLSKGEREILEELYAELRGLPSVIDIFGFTGLNFLDRCQQIRESIALEIRTLSDNTFGVSPSSQDAVFKQFIDGIADGIVQGFIPVEAQKQILNGLLAQKHIIANLNNYYASLRDNTNSLAIGIEKLKSKLDYAVSNVLQSRTFYEFFMFKIQSIVIFLIMALFPIVVAISFLPAFGYNFRLLFTYAFSYYLIKLWLPVYFIAYQFLTGKMFAILSNAVSFILPPPAYAGALEVYTALSTSLPETTKFTNLLLNSLAMAIPTALGGGALVLIGRDFYVATQKSITESLLTAKMAGFMFSRGVGSLANRAGGFGNTTGAGSGVSSSSYGSGGSGTITLSESIKSGGGAITYQATKDEKSGLWIAQVKNISSISERTSTIPSKNKFDEAITGISKSGIYLAK